MKVESFIARRLRFEGRVAIIAIAISFFVIIMAVAISGGFRTEIHSAVSSASGDVIISEDELSLSELDIEKISKIEGVQEVQGCVYSPGIVKKGGQIRGVIFKGTDKDSLQLHARVPASFAEELSLKQGDEFICYFISEQTRVRKFTISEIYDNPVDTEDTFIAYVPASDLRRIKSWDEDRVSQIEITLSQKYTERNAIKQKTEEIGIASGLRAEAARDRYSAIFSWLDLIDYNVYAILILMTIVAAFNMISGLLILLFRHISTIGKLKTMGMTDKSIAGIFLRVSARIVAIGMLSGNALSLIICWVQDTFKLIKLNPENYFVSHVPVEINIGSIIATDAISFVAIMLLLSIPCLFISKIDPSSTVKTE